MIVYVAIDSAGNTANSTRTVIIEAPPVASAPNPGGVSNP
jgi:hypothetical protein